MRAHLPLSSLAGAAFAFGAAICSLHAQPRMRPGFLENLPIPFEENQGQAPADVRYFARGPGYVLALGARQAELHVASQAAPVTLALAGGNNAPKLAAEGELPGHVNDYSGSDPHEWRTGIPTYARIRYRDVYPGVDLMYYGRNGALEYDFIVAPGADPARIKLVLSGYSRTTERGGSVFPAAVEGAAAPCALSGIQPLRIDSAGDLIAGAGRSETRFRKPVIYQRQPDGAERSVRGGFHLDKGQTITFDLGDYDARLPLIIDPILAFSTYLGGGGSDTGYGVSVDPSGNIVIAGETYSAALTPNNPALRSNKDAFVVKLNPSGTAVLYSTFLGGSQSDSARAIAVDAIGNAYVAGITTSSNFPTTPGAYQTAYGGQEDGFAFKLNSSGNVVYSTLLGSTGSDNAVAVAVDAAGDAYVAGYTSSGTYPVTPGVVQSQFKGGYYDAFVTVLNPAGSGAIYSTLLGGSGSDVAYSIAVDSSGSAYLGGYTTSSDFPMQNAMQVSYGGLGDGFVAKLNSTGSQLFFSTYFGGSAFDEITSIALDAAQNVYAGGFTGSIDFPATAGAFQTSNHGSYDAFVAKLNTGGNSLAYATYLGGAGADQVTGMAVDAQGNAYVSGFTISSNFPTMAPVQANDAGGFDAFIAEVNPAGTALTFATYLGGAGDDRAYAIALSGGNGIIATGSTSSANFPVTSGAMQTQLGGGYDAFVLELVTPPPAVAGITPNSGTGNVQTFSAVFSDAGGYGSLSQVYLLINSIISDVSACMIRYDLTANAFYLVNDAGNGYLGPITPGQNGLLQNSRCILNGSASSASGSGSNLTVKAALAFTSLFTGSWNLLQYAQNAAGTSSGWQQTGTWSAPSNATPSTIAVAPNAGSGANQQFNALYFTPGGVSGLSVAYVLINSVISDVNACMIEYVAQGNLLYLVNDAGTGYLGPLIVGSSGVLQNSRCNLSGAGSSASVSGNTLSLNVALSFFSPFIGNWNVWLYDQDAQGHVSGWQQQGTWTIPSSAPSTEYARPASGSGSAQIFSGVYFAPGGASTLGAVYVLFNNVVSDVNSCMVQYNVQTNVLSLVNDAGSGYLPGITPGGAGIAQNSRCVLSATGSSVSISGDYLTLNLSMNFLPLFSGTWQIMLYDQDTSGRTSGWQSRGAWTVTSTPGPVPIGLAPNSGSGLSQTFNAEFLSPNGAGSLSQVYLLINNVISDVNACMVRYDVGAGLLYLVNDAGNGYLGGLRPGGAGVIQNSRCAIVVSSSAVVTAGNTIDVSLAIAFTPLYAGTWNLSLYAQDVAGLTSGWQKEGTWTVLGSALPAVLSIAPNSGSGITQTFTARFSAPSGFNTLASVFLLVNNAISNVNTCMVLYNVQSNLLYLVNDQGTGYLGGIPPGSSSYAQNSRCVLHAAGSSVSGSGGVLTVNVALSFEPLFAGTWDLMLYAQDVAGLTSGWQQQGVWTVP
ncbi:MAG: SBBP repeat-containing protein [Bryobacteraceae bacterium]